MVVKAVPEPWGSLFARAALVFLTTRTALGVFVWLTGQHFRCVGPRCTDRGFFPGNFLLNGLFQWDALQYSMLASSGYVRGEGFETTAPFFPGFPVAARALGSLLGSSLWAGIALNWIFAVVGAVFAARLAERILDDPAAGRTASLVWLLGPLSFFFNVFLSESLFSALTCIALWAALSGMPMVFALSGFAAAATRNAGIVVIACGALLVWETHGWKTLRSVRWLAAVACALSGFVVVLWTQAVAFGNPWEWVDAQRRWGRRLVLPWVTLRNDWIGFPVLDPNRRNVDAMYRAQEVLAACLTLPLLAVFKRTRIPLSLAALGAALWLLPLLSNSLISFARYQSANVYLVLALAWMMSRSPAVRAVTWWAFGLVVAWYASTFPHGVWAS